MMLDTPSARSPRAGWPTPWPGLFPLVVTLTAVTTSDQAQGADVPRPPIPAPAASDDDLIIFTDQPEVVSASHQLTPLTLSAAPVSVISADEIMAGGHTNLAEALQCTPGVDVERTDRNVYAVGVHGLFGSVSDRTLIHVNGRSAIDPLLGGSELITLPLFMPDIGHIEIDRGPGGAAWGANALDGVIHFITKVPEDNLGVFITSGITEFGDTLSQGRLADTSGTWAWRTSVGYQSHESSAHALHDCSLPDNDWLHGWMTDNEVVYHLDPATKLSSGIGHADARGGAYELLDRPPDDESFSRTTRAIARIDHRFDEQMRYQLEWHGNYEDNDHPGFAASRDNQDVVDGQVDVVVLRQHHFTVGAEASYTTLDEAPNGDPYQIIVVDAPYQERRYSGYLIDRWQISTPLVFEGQFREDRYSGTGNDWSGRLSAIYTPDTSQAVRLRVSKADRNPMASIRDAAINVPIDGNPAIRFIVLPGEDLSDEETWAGEFGHSHQLSDDLLLRWDSTYRHDNGLIGCTTVAPNLLGPPPSITTDQPANIAGAKANSSELELRWTARSGMRCDVWYAFDDLETEEIDQQIRAFKPPKHSVGASTSVPLPWHFTATVNYRYTDATIDPGGASGYHVDLYHHLDLTLGWRFDQERGELMIGVLDVLGSRDAPVQNTGSVVAYQTPERTFFNCGGWGF